MGKNSEQRSSYIFNIYNTYCFFHGNNGYANTHQCFFYTSPALLHTGFLNSLAASQASRYVSWMWREQPANIPPQGVLAREAKVYTYTQELVSSVEARTAKCQVIKA